MGRRNRLRAITEKFDRPKSFGPTTLRAGASGRMIEPIMRRPKIAGAPKAIALACCCMVAALAAVPAAQAAPPLIAQWPLEASHTSGPTELTDDVSGNGLALTSGVGAMKFGTAEGKFNGYLTNANATNLQVSSPLLAPQQITLLAWIKQNGNPGDLRYIAGRGHDGGTCSGSSYALYTGPGVAPGLHFYIRQPGPGGPDVRTDAPPNSSVFDNQWHLVAGTFDGASIRLFVDGAQVGPAKPASGITYAPPITESMFYVDGYPPQAGCFGNFDFPGQIDEVRVYERALSPSELGRLAAAPGPTPPVLEQDGGAPPQVVGPSPKVTASLIKPATNALKSATVLKLNTSGPVLETKIKLDGKPALTVPPSASGSYISFNLSKPGDHLVSATTIGAGGISASASAKVTAVSGPGRIKFPEAAISSSTLDLLATTYENNQCVPNSTSTFGIVEVTGCFRKLNPDGTLPPLERSLVEEYVAVNNVLEHERKEFIPGGPGQLTTIKKLAADPALQPFVTDQVVHVNGMTVEPVGSASLIVFPLLQRMVSSNARMKFDGSVLGSIPVKSGPLNLDLRSGLKRLTSGDERLSLFEFDTSKAFGDIGGFPINGKVEVVFEKKAESRSTALKVNLSLPDEISTAAGANPTAKVEINADNKRGTYLGVLNIHLGEAFIGPVELANVDFTYIDAGEPAQECPRKWWKATAEVFFLPGASGQEGAGLKMAPEPQRNGVAFCAGEFHSAGADLKFGYPFLPPPQLFPGVTLNEVGFSIQVHDPVVFDGYATIKAAELVEATGGFLTAFASPGHPYTFKPGDAGGSMPLLSGKTFTSTTVALGGSVKLKPFDDVSLGLGSAFLLYSYPDFIQAAGSAHFQTFLFAIDAGGSIELSTKTRKYNALVEGRVCLAGGVEVAHVSACAGGEARASSRGISVCFNIGDGAWTPGVGYVYGATLPEFFLGAAGDGCKPSHFWEKPEDVRGRISAAPGGTLTFKVKPGEKVKNVELTGSGGAPAVTVIAPDGERLATDPNQMLHGKKLSVLAAARYDRAWIGVEDAKPGVYKVIPQPGSVPIANVRETHYEPDADVKASVTGKGHHLVLHYDAGHAKNQVVSFYERGKGTWNLLKQVKGGKGTFAFVPSFGPAGRREIAVQVEVDGIPSPLQTLDHFKAPPPPKASRVKQVRVVRHGSKLTVSWQKAPFAQGYSVVTEASGGAVRSQRVKAKRSAVTVKGIPVTEAGRVEVVAFGPLRDRGKPGKAKYKALRKPETRLLSFKELGTGATEPAAKKGKKAKGKH